MIDIVTHLENDDLNSYRDMKRVTNKIEMLPGGTGAMFATAATEEGFDEVVLIGKIGANPNAPDCPDLPGELINAALKSRSICTITPLSKTHNTGQTVIVYLPNDQRLLVVDKGANATFGVEDISREMVNAIESTDVLFVSGYSLLVPEQAAATATLMEIAQQANSLVVLDVVPHKLYTTFTGDYFRKFTQNADILVSEINTVKRLFFTGHHALPGSNISVDDVALKVLEDYPIVILRPSTNHEFIYDRHNIIAQGPTGYAYVNADNKRGFSERLTARAISNHFARFTRSKTK